MHHYLIPLIAGTVVVIAFFFGMACIIAASTEPPGPEDDRLAPGPSFSNCCEPFGSEQNPQVPLASEDAFAQVPGNAETAVGVTAGGPESFRDGPHGRGEMPRHSLSRPTPAVSQLSLINTGDPQEDNS